MFIRDKAWIKIFKCHELKVPQIYPLVYIILSIIEVHVPLSVIVISYIYRNSTIIIPV